MNGAIVGVGAREVRVEGQGYGSGSGEERGTWVHAGTVIGGGAIAVHVEQELMGGTVAAAQFQGNRVSLVNSYRRIRACRSVPAANGEAH